MLLNANANLLLLADSVDQDQTAQNAQSDFRSTLSDKEIKKKKKKKKKMKMHILGFLYRPESSLNLYSTKNESCDALPYYRILDFSIFCIIFVHNKLYSAQIMEIRSEGIRKREKKKKRTEG